ncbi:MAG TPA: phosphatase PAP2 family protein [Mariprofundaceae bacterium]|nr:phosphatase PAP2 family protein [Mariprofundaceae bacterium]
MPKGRSRIILYAAWAIGGLLLVPAWYFNHPLFLLINGWHGAAADAVLGVISGLGDGLPAVVLLTALMLWRFQAGLAGMAGYAMSGILAQVLKHLFDMPRPPAVFEHVHVLGAALTSRSFPSGHSATDGTMAVLCLYLWGVRDGRAWAGMALFLVAAYGRIYGGVHFPFDVATGLMLGWISMVVCWQWFQHQRFAAWGRSAWGWRAPAMLLVVEAVVLGMGYRIQPSTARPLAFALSVAALFWVTQSWRIRRGNQGSF